jgi:hypothetical protein
VASGGISDITRRAKMLKLKKYFSYHAEIAENAPTILISGKFFS